jgi:cell division protein FtsW (lipid II flippase)
MESPFITTITNIYLYTLLFLTLLFIVSKITNNYNEKSLLLTLLIILISLQFLINGIPH